MHLDIKGYILRFPIEAVYEFILYLRIKELESGESVTLGPLWKQLEILMDGNTNELAECNFKRGNDTIGLDWSNLLSDLGICREIAECNLRGESFIIGVFFRFLFMVWGGKLTQSLGSDIHDEGIIKVNISADSCW